MKRCTKCGEEKELDGFSRDNRRVAGRQAQCKACDHAYYLADKEAIDARNKEYTKAHPEETRRRHQRYSQEHKQQVTAWASAWKASHPEQGRARSAVNYAVSTGKLIRLNHCEDCGKETKAAAHHYLGYAPEHVFDVRWLCSKCHTIANLRDGKFQPKAEEEWEQSENGTEMAETMAPGQLGQDSYQTVPTLPQLPPPLPQQLAA